MNILLLSLLGLSASLSPSVYSYWSSSVMLITLAPMLGTDSDVVACEDRSAFNASCNVNPSYKDFEKPFKSNLPEIAIQYNYVDENIPLFDIGYQGDPIFNIETGTLGNDLIYVNDDLPPNISSVGHRDVSIQDGNDIIVVQSTRHNLHIYGAGGDDTLIGNELGDHIYGGNGDDNVLGYDGNDFLYGNDGDDFIMPGRGHDHVYGNEGNDTFCIDAIEGSNLTIDGGAGNDTLKLCTFDASQDWSIEIGDKSAITLSDLMLNPFKYTKSINSVPNKEITISNKENSIRIVSRQVENIDIEPYYQFNLDSGKQLDLKNTIGIAVKVIPSFELKGDVSPVYVNHLGESLQNIEPSALMRGDIFVSAPSGYIGKIEFPVKIFVGSGENLKIETASVTLDVLPTQDALLFAQTGSVKANKFSQKSFSKVSDNRFANAAEVTRLPLDILINPDIKNAQIEIDLLEGLLLDKNKKTIGDKYSAVTLSKDQLAGLWLQSEGQKGYIEIKLTGSFNSQLIAIQKRISVYSKHEFYNVNGNIEYSLKGNRDNFDVSRVGNTLVITPLDQHPAFDEAIRLSMLGLDYVLFQDAAVSVHDFYHALDMSKFQSNTDDSVLILF